MNVKPRSRLEGPRKGAVVAMAVLSLATASRAAEPVLTLSKPIELPALTEESLIAIPLDPQVYSATQDDLDDLRLLDADGRPVPFLLRRLQTTRRRTERISWTARNPSARPLPEGGLEVTVTLDDDDPHPTGVRLVTPLLNFEQRARVETSVDGATWAPAGDAAVIFDYSRYMDVRNDSIPFPETNRRRFRITIDDVTAEQESQLVELTRRLQGDEELGQTARFTVDRRPFRIDRIEFYREVERPQSAGDEQAEYPVASLRVEESVEDRQTIVTIETWREPLTAFEIATPSRNFSRRAEVQVERAQGATRDWRTIGESTISRLDFAGQRRAQLRVSFPESRAKTYRMVISNRDSPPLKIDAVAAEGHVYEVVSFAQPDDRYTLAYADPQAEAPEYDIAALNALLASGVRPLPARLGDQQTTPAAGRPQAPSLRDVINNPGLLIGLVVILIIALGWGLYLAVKRVDTLPKDQ